MTDFRRPDLDLWEEEDAEDGRPTIVSERPTAAPVNAGSGRTLNGRSPKSTKASDKTIPFGTVPGDRKTPEVQRSGLVQRLIEQGALEDEAARNSVEELRDSEIDLLKLPPDPEVEDATVVEPTLDLVSPTKQKGAPIAARNTPRVIAGVETEPATDDQVPTVSVKRPLPPVAVELRNVGAILPGPDPSKAAVAPEARASTERDVTERISIPSVPIGMIGSIAPATRSLRPAANERKGMPFWQTALAALVLLGGGISIAKFQAEQRSQSSALSSQPAPISEPALSRAAEPGPAAALAAPPAAEPAATSVTPQPSAPTAPVPEQALSTTAPAPSAAPPAVVAPALPKRDESLLPVSRTRRVRERTAFASAEPLPAEIVPKPPAAEKPVAKTSEPVPAHPSREQVASSLDSVTGELQKCVGDRHGLAQVTVTVRPAGFVSYAVVSGEYAGTSEGSCIARAVRTAKFPQFSEPTLRVTYPFQL